MLSGSQQWSYDPLMSHELKLSHSADRSKCNLGLNPCRRGSVTELRLTAQGKIHWIIPWTGIASCGRTKERSRGLTFEQRKMQVILLFAYLFPLSEVLSSLNPFLLFTCLGLSQSWWIIESICLLLLDLLCSWWYSPAQSRRWVRVFHW